MSCKWILLLFFVSLTHGERTTSWTENEIKKFVKQNLKDFNAKLQKILDHKDVSYSFKKMLSSKKDLKGCVKLLDDQLVNRQQKINVISSKVKNAWISSDIKHISNLKVNGRILSKEKNMISKIQFNFKTNGSSFLVLNKTTQKVSNKIKLTQSDLKKTLFKTQYQVIKGKIILKNVNLIRSKIDKIKHHITINRLQTSRLPSAIKRNGNQIIRNKISITNVSCMKSTIDFLNENKIEDFVQLNSGTMTLTGSYRFGNVSATTVYLKSAINGQKIENIVLISRDQIIYGIKEFKRLSAGNVEASRVGEVRIHDLKKVSTNSPLAVNILSTLIIQGNLNVASLNGYDVTKLFLNTLRTNKVQSIKGMKGFQSMVIGGNFLTGRINNCSFDHFMTTNTKQYIYANATFQNSSNFQNILTNSVNGIDLSQQAVIKSRSNVLKGRKIFTTNLTVKKDVTLKKGIPIDTFDPSVENSQILNKNDTGQQFYNVNIGTINVTDLEIDINYLPQVKKFYNVWLKTSEQIIPYLKTKDLSAQKLNVSRLNNITLEDLVTVEGDVFIQEPIHFSEKIFTKTLNLKEYTNMNFLPEYWNSQKVNVSKNVTIERALLRGNLTVSGSFKNFESDIMHINDSQTTKGFVEFEKIKVKSLSFTDFNFEKINNTNIRDFLNRSVVKPINRSIHNKSFKTLIGSDIVCNGVLNNISLSKVVLKNNNQTITAPWKFTGRQSFQNITVKNFFGDIRLEDIISTNKNSTIYNKQFNENIATNHLYASGYINGVNISSLHQEAFNKSKNYSLKRKFTFKKNVTMDKLQITGSKINNMSLDDVIRMDALSDSIILNVSNIIVQNVNVSGQINGCDLKPVAENTFTLQESKNVVGRTEAKDLLIEGNLNIINLKGERFEDWASFFKTNSSPKIETVIEFENINADNIDFAQTLNNLPTDFLLKDTVRKNLKQDITSKKAFAKLVAKKSATSTLYSNKIVGIDPSELFESYINKTENRTSALLNSFLKNLASKQVTITGKLNNLALPNDVVLSDVNEKIWADVVVNNTVNTPMGLHIAGKIGGINLEDFINSRVTLNGNQDIFSTLVFYDSINLKGNTGLNATINSIRLENAFKRHSNQTINGNKYFNSLNTSSDVTVHEFVNGARLEQFLWSSKNESVKEVQFVKLNTTNITCDKINGVNIDDLYIHLHNMLHDVDDEMHRLTSDVQSHKYSLEIMEDSLEHHSSLFSYFELHETIKFGPILKFLPVYEYGTVGEKYELQVTQMVMWTDSQMNGCKKITSLIADVWTNGTFSITKEMRGKVFPFTFQIERDDDLIGFYVQAEYTQKCSPFIRNLKIKEIFQNSPEYQINNKISMPEDARLLDVQLLEKNDDIFLIVAFSMKGPGERVFLYHYDASNNSWSEHQKFHTENLTTLEFIVFEKYNPPDVYLSVTGDEKNPGVMVYEWDFDNDEFFLKTNLSTTASTHAVWLHAHNKLYLLLAKEKIETIRNHTRVDIFNEPLEVYTLEEDELELNHIVNLKAINFIEPFILAGEIFILATSSHMEMVYILQFRGYNGFEVIQEIPTTGVSEARIFNTDNQLYLAINSRIIQSRILKASMRGARSIIERHDQTDY